MKEKKEQIQSHSGRKKRRGSSRKAGILLAAGVGAVLLVGGLTARYRTENRQQAEISSAQFHVTSDYLEEEGAAYPITNWSNGFQIQLYNYEKENLALVSDEDISYTVTVEPAEKWKCADSSDGKLEGKGTAKTNILVISPKDSAAIKQNDAVTVTVSTTEPFTKNLSATFTVASKALPDYELKQSSEDNNQWHLIIKTNDYADQVKVSWPKDALCPDTTSQYMEKWTNNGTESLDVQDNTTYDLVFFSIQGGSKFTLDSTDGTNVTIQ